MLALTLAGPAPVEAAFTASTAGTGSATAAATFPRCYDDAVTADSPVSYWHLDETSGTTAADSVGSRNGSYTGGYTLNQSAAQRSTGKAATFNGSTGYVSVPYAAALNPATFTVEAWVKATSIPGSGLSTVVGSWNDNATSKGYWLGIRNPTGAWELQIGTGGSQTNVTGPAVTLNSWYHLVATYDGTTAKLYVNGTLFNSAGTTYSANASQPFGVGAYYSAGSSAWTGFLTGSIDEPAVYSGARTATQVRTHYNTGRCYKDVVKNDGPLAYWRMDDAAGTTVRDLTGAYPGAYVGSPTLGAAGGITQDSDTAVTVNGGATAQYGKVPYTAALNPSTFTVEAWAKPTGGAGTNRAILSSLYDSGAGAVRGFLLGIDSSNRWWLSIGNGSGYGGVATGTPTLNSWAHVVGTYDGTTARLYVNGILVGSSAATYSANTVSNVVIGAWRYLGSTTNKFPGTVDDVAVYGTALSLSQIQSHYLTGRSYQDTVLDSSPVSYWRLGESSGTSTADVKGSAAGTYVGGPSLGQPGGLAGDADTSVRFSGSGQYVNVPFTATLNSTQFTVEAWAQLTSTGSWQTVAASSTAGSGASSPGYWLGIGSTAWTFTVNNGTTGDVVLTGPTASASTWVHLVGTYDGTTARFYVNGSLAASSTTAYSRVTSTTPFEIGAEDNGSTIMTGWVDDVAYYGSALSATQIQLHYDSGRQ